MARHLARSAFASQNARNRMFGALFEGLMNDNGTPLWCEAHLQVKMCKTPAFRYVWSSRCGKGATEEIESLILN